MQALWQQGTASGTTAQCLDGSPTPTSGFGPQLPASVTAIQIRYRNLDTRYACCVAFDADPAERSITLVPVDSGNAEITILGYPTSDTSIEEETPLCNTQTQAVAVRLCGTGFASPSFRSDPKQFVVQPGTTTTVGKIEINAVPFLVPSPQASPNPGPNGTLDFLDLALTIADAHSGIDPGSIIVEVTDAAGATGTLIAPVGQPCHDCMGRIPCSMSLAVVGFEVASRLPIILAEGPARLVISASNNEGRPSTISYPFTVLSTPTPSATPTITPTPTDTPCAPRGLQPPSARVMILLSANGQGQSATGKSNAPAINEDGTVVAFSSNAPDLVPQSGVDGQTDVYFVTRVGLRRGVTERVSLTTDGNLAMGDSQTDGLPPGIDADGQVIAFQSSASNLVPDDTNAAVDVFIRNRLFSFTERISSATTGDQGNGPSRAPATDADGLNIVFESLANNLVPDDSNGVSDIFLSSDAVTDLLSVADQRPTNGTSSSPTISADGRTVAFVSEASNLVDSDTNGVADVFVLDLATNLIERVSIGFSGEADGPSDSPKLSADGQIVTFRSLATNLVPMDTNGVADVFVRDRSMGATERVSVDSCGHQSNGPSGAPAVNGSGQYVSFVSSASNLVPDDINGFRDVFVFSRRAVSPARVSLEQQSNARPGGNSADVATSMSSDGRWVAFASAAENLVSSDLNDQQDSFLACNPFESCTPPIP